MAKAAIEIPDDYLAGLRRCADTEKGDLSAFVIQAMLENYEAAKEDRRAMCGDTGVPRWYVKIGNEARIQGGPVALEAALRRATANATHDVPLRPNRVHPLWRTDHNNNVGIGAPEIEYAFHPDADWIDLTTVHKGGLFGSDYRMLFPGDGIDGIKRFYLDTLIGFGQRGLACQPAIVGVGLGGSKDISMVLGKQASCLRTVGSRNPDPKIAALEEELKELGNTIGMGAMGFMGTSMVVDCHIEVGYCHTGGMPMSVHMFCLSSRRATARVFPDGRAEFRTDPSGSPTTCAARPWNGSGRWPRRRSKRNGSAQDRPSEASGEHRGSAQAGDRLGRLSHGPRLHRARGRLQARDRGWRRHAGIARGARPRQFPLFAGGRGQCRRQLHGRRRHRDRVVPLRQVARRLVRAVGLQHHHRQGRHDVAKSTGARSCRISAIYLTTVGYGTGALLGRGIKRVASVYWLEELGLAQAVWVLDVENFGPFLVESDLDGKALFERENAKIAPGIEKLYDGTRPATMRRYGETDDKTQEVI